MPVNREKLDQTIETGEFSLLPSFSLIPFSSDLLNEYTGGGMQYGTLNGIYGQWGTGKTTLCRSLVKWIIQHNIDYPDNLINLLYLDADAASGYNANSHLQMLNSIGIDVTLEEVINGHEREFTTGSDRKKDILYKKYLDAYSERVGFYIRRPITIQELERMVKDLLNQDQWDIVFVDSLTLYFKDKCTQDAAVKGQGQFGGVYKIHITTMLIALEQFAKKTNACVVCTAQRLSEFGLEKKLKNPKDQIREFVGTDVPAYKYNFLIKTTATNGVFKFFIQKNRSGFCNFKGIPFDILEDGSVA